MSVTGIILAAVIVGGTGLFIGAFLGIAGKQFAVEVDEREEAIAGVLPGNNCGGCGYAGCSGLAAAIVKGEAEISGCPVGGSPVAAKIGEIMGIEATESKPMTAFVKCGGTCEKAKEDYKYYGVEDCIMMNFVQNGGPKACSYGCLGYGTCVKACPFDAIHIVDGIAVVDKEACKACGKCVAVCPKSLIELVPQDQIHLVNCSSKDKGKEVMAVCSAGCIGCKMCEKVCKFDAIKVEDNIAHIDPEKCTNCGACAEKCPKKTIS
ncbi:RnfABCDGE type electron transport complex subunit B [Lachnospiraceae bacterium LCP25S3_G4]